MMLYPHTSISSCAICSSPNLKTLWDLPNFPFTEKYGKYTKNEPLACDQALLICEECGHIQLQNQIDPKLLYTASEYSFRTTQSKSALDGSHFFIEFFRALDTNERKNVIDIGGNDTYLVNLLGSSVKKSIIDPIRSEEDGAVKDNVNIIGRFIEEIQINEACGAVDLVFCRHVLEHIARPRLLLEKLFKECSSDTLYVFEIPCIESLLEAFRFDAIFHQHYHYYDLSTFKTLIELSGGEYISHRYNHQGSCGGALLIAFKKATSRPIVSFGSTTQKIATYQKAIQNFTKFMGTFSEFLQSFNQNIYGYGASLMLATLGYHLKTNFNELICILDDDEMKHDMEYKNIPVSIRNTKRVAPPFQSNYLITSLENKNRIYQKLLTLSPRRILVPSLT